jgi:monovalent cation:H+ antiporter, CPA1 family
MDEFNRLQIFVTLLLIASAVALAVKWVKVPYAIALVIVGLIIGFFNLLPPITIDSELILLVFLPGLLFEASWNLDLKQLRADWLPISLLATVGVAISMGVVAAMMTHWAGFSLWSALLFGAILSATDPISVIALFKKLGVDKRLTILIEGESLFNDGTAVVLFRVILAMVVTGTVATPLALTSQLLVVCAGGTAVGLALGLCASKVTRLFDDHLLEITLTTILAYGSYLLADHIGVSPVLAVVVAGIVMGNYGSRTSMSPSTRLAVNAFWEYVAFATNSFVFLLIGLQIHYDLLVRYSAQIGIGIAAILLARIVIVYGLLLVSGKLGGKAILLSWQHVMFWGGLRGALSIAMALSLPVVRNLQPEPIVVTTFGVVLFTLLVPGLTVEPLIKFLKIRSSDETLQQYRALSAELMAIKAGFEHLDLMHKEGRISARTFYALRTELTSEEVAVVQQIEAMHLSNSALQQIEQSEAGLELLNVRKDLMLTFLREGRISAEDAHALRSRLDARTLFLTRQEEIAVESRPEQSQPEVSAEKPVIEQSIESPQT